VLRFISLVTLLTKDRDWTLEGSGWIRERISVVLFHVLVDFSWYFFLACTNPIYSPNLIWLQALWVELVTWSWLRMGTHSWRKWYGFTFYRNILLTSWWYMCLVVFSLIWCLVPFICSKFRTQLQSWLQGRLWHRMTQEVMAQPPLCFLLGS